MLSKITKFLGKGRKGTGRSPSWMWSIVELCSLELHTGITRKRPNGGTPGMTTVHIRQPPSDSQHKTISRFGHYWIVGWVTEFIKNLSSFNTLGKQTELSPMCIHWNWRQHQKIQRRNTLLQSNQEYIRKKKKCCLWCFGSSVSTASNRASLQMTTHHNFQTLTVDPDSAATPSQPAEAAFMRNNG